MDWNTGLYKALYATFGVPAVLKVGQNNIALTVIDQTSGIEINAPGVELPTIVPAAIVRISECNVAGLSQDKLLDASIIIGGRTWTVANVAEKPGPTGKDSGEWVMTLANGDL